MMSAPASLLTPPATPRLDVLGRMPVPLRRPFKAGLDRVLAAEAGRGQPLSCSFLSGAEWYSPFDRLDPDMPASLPAMLVTTFQHDILAPALLAHYTPQHPACEAVHPVCRDAGLVDPQGVFQLFATIPFVFLIDERRLRGRTPPRSWQDLLDPVWADEIVFGGWRPSEHMPYQDYNSYLMLNLQREFGHDGLQAFAANVKHLQHNIRTTTQAGSNARTIGAISILPWLQAELCPRRERTRVVWPEDGALCMPIASLLQPDDAVRLRPLREFLHGEWLAQLLARNCYPASHPGVAGFPPGARLKWLGWDYVRQHDVAAESRHAAARFFAAWYARHPVEDIQQCG